MTGIDIFVLTLMGAGAVLGFLRGFVQEAFSLVAWVMVVFGVWAFHTLLTDRLIAPVGSENGASVLAFLSIVIVTYAVGRWLARTIGEKSRKSVLGPVDRVLGLGFGMIKGLIGGTLIYLLAILVYDTVYGTEAKRPQWLLDSRTYPLLHASGNAMSGFAREQQSGVDTPTPEIQ